MRGTSRNPTGWCFKRGQDPTSPLRRSDVEVVSTGLVIRTLSVETTGKEWGCFFRNFVVSTGMVLFL